MSGLGHALHGRLPARTCGQLSWGCLLSVPSFIHFGCLGCLGSGCLCGLTVVGITICPAVVYYACSVGATHRWAAEVLANSMRCDALCASELLIGCLPGLTDISPYVERSAGFKPVGSWCVARTHKFVADDVPSTRVPSGFMPRDLARRMFVCTCISLPTQVIRDCRSASSRGASFTVGSPGRCAGSRL